MAQARQFTAIELRSYVAVDKFKVDVPSVREYKVSARVSNRGRTPALNVTIRRVFFYTDATDTESIQWPEDRLAGTPPTLVSLQPEGEAFPSATARLDVETFSLLASKKGYLYAAYMVTYEDVFGDRHERRVGVAFKGGSLSMHPVPGQNSERRLTNDT